MDDWESDDDICNGSECSGEDNHGQVMSPHNSIYFPGMLLVLLCADRGLTPRGIKKCIFYSVQQKFHIKLLNKWCID